MAHLTRRSFLVGSGVAAAGLAGALAGCSTAGSGTGASSGSAGTGSSTGSASRASELQTATITKEADVVVVGLGASGLLAAYGAAAAGAHVIALDAAESMSGVTNTRTSAAFAVGSSLQAVGPEPLTIEEYLNYLNNGTNYQSNNKALRRIIEASGRAVDVFVSAGMPFNVDFTKTNKETAMMQRGGCVYGVNGDERAEYFTKVVDSVGVECLFGTAATALIYDADGTVAGLQCESGSDIIDISAEAVILATGGMLGSAEETAKYFAGATIVNMGNSLCMGTGINLARDAGAQIGKCFSISMNEYGGAHPKATPTYAFRPNTGTNEAMRLPVFGGILLDKSGRRFINEGVMCEKTMFCCEPLVRESYHYALCDEAFMKRWETEALPAFLGDARMKGMFADVVASDIREQFDRAVDEGWAFKAETLAEVAEHFGLTHLEETIESYNGYCAAGRDEQFFVAPNFLKPVQDGPFYIVESLPAGWLSLGGIKCNEFMQAVDSSNALVDGLYVVGADADLFTSPYYAPGSANGFSLASGLIAGEAAAEFAQG